THRSTARFRLASGSSHATRSSRPRRAPAVPTATKDGTRQWPRSRWSSSCSSSTSPMRVESRGRARALQALYAWDIRPGQDLYKVADRVWFDLAVSPEERQFASGIVKTYARAQQQLDDRLIDVTD